MILRQNNGMIPGGIRYQDPRTAKAVWNDDHTFLESRVREIIAFRRGNPNLYPEPDWTNETFVTNQVIDQNCARLGNDSNWCLQGSVPSVSVPLSTQRFCPDCGNALVPKFCPTCAGKRIIGYRCEKCGKEQPK